MARIKKFKAPRVTTVVGQDTEIRGDLQFKGGLHVDGTVRGNVIGDSDESSTLTLSEAGTVEGEVRVANVILNGTVRGDVRASQRVELAPMAKVTGNVYYQLIEMAMGAEVNGQLVHGAAAPEAVALKTLVEARQEPVSEPDPTGDVEVVRAARDGEGAFSGTDAEQRQRRGRIPANS